MLWHLVLRYQKLLIVLAIALKSINKIKKISGKIKLSEIKNLETRLYGNCVYYTLSMNELS